LDYKWSRESEFSGAREKKEEEEEKEPSLGMVEKAKKTSSFLIYPNELV